MRDNFQYLAQFTAPRGGSGAIQIFSIHYYGTLRRGLNYGFSFIIAYTAIDLPSPWSITDYHFHRRDGEKIDFFDFLSIRLALSIIDKKLHLSIKN